MQVPEFLLSMLLEQYGENITKNIIEGYNKKRNVTLRVNTLKANCSEIKNKLNESNIEFDTVPWSNEALIIKNSDEKNIRNLEIYENGQIYLQSLSSMLPPIVLEPKSKENILDMAAAPGGKTTEIAALTNNETFITACEKNPIRAERLKYNVEKQGATSTYIMVQDALKLDDFFSFDKILLDAPCSGSGIIDINDEKLEKIFTINLINKSVASQLSLLKKAIKMLKTGGELVYSTCSILSCENEDILKKAINGTKAQIVPIQIKNGEKIPLLPVKLAGTICICPNEYYEGFFIAKIRKN